MDRRILLCIPAILLTSCGKADESITVEESIGTETFQQAMPVNGKVEDPDHGQETWFAYGAMSGNEWIPANGVVEGHGFEDGTYIMTMQLNVEPAADGFFYEAWFEAEGKSAVSAGHMGNHFGDARHQLRFQSPDDLSDHLKVTVTKEADDGNPGRGTNVAATGTLKVTRRP